MSDQQLHCTFQTFSVVNILTILTGVGSEIKSMIVLLSPLVCVVVVVVFSFWFLLPFCMAIYMYVYAKMSIEFTVCNDELMAVFPMLSCFFICLGCLISRSSCEHILNLYCFSRVGKHSFCRVCRQIWEHPSDLINHVFCIFSQSGWVPEMYFPLLSYHVLAWMASSDTI